MIGTILHTRNTAVNKVSALANLTVCGRSQAFKVYSMAGGAKGKGEGE